MDMPKTWDVWQCHAIRHFEILLEAVSKLRYSGLDFSSPSGIEQAPWQQRRRYACPISVWYDNYNTQSYGFETLAVRRLTAYWIETLKL